MTPWLDDGDVTVYAGDCIQVMRELAAESVDAVICDPPYGLEFMGKSWDRLGDVGKSSHQGFADEPGFKGFKLASYSASSNVKCGRCAKWKWDHEGRKCECGPDAIWPNVAAHQGRLMQDWHYAWAVEAFRVLKPGGHLAAFGGTRTAHRLAAGIEDAGFEIRDTLAYMFGSGFPKSHNLDRVLVKCGCGADPQTQHGMHPVRDADVPPAVPTRAGQGSLLLEGMPEPSASAHGAARPEPEATGLEEPGVEGRRDVLQEEGHLRADADQVRAVPAVGAGDGAEGRVRDGAPPSDGDALRVRPDANGSGASPRPRPVEQRAGEPGTLAVEQRAQADGAWPVCSGCGLPRIPSGLGTALKPGYEPVTLARKPLSGTVAANVLAHGTGALHIDATRIGTTKDIPASPKKVAPSAHTVSLPGKDGTSGFDPNVGRWPANVILDEAAAGMLDQQTGELHSQDPETRKSKSTATGVTEMGTGRSIEYAGKGGASRFFYTAKASGSERNDGLHDLPASIDGRPVEGFRDGSLHRVNTTRSDQGPSERRERRNSHPTVKPVDLMRWLIRLLAPPGALILDPFAGSGTTGVAARRESVRCILIEREAEYLPIIAGRLSQLSLL